MDRVQVRVVDAPKKQKPLSLRRRMNELTHSNAFANQTARFLKTVGLDGAPLDRASYDQLLTSYRDQAFAASNGEDFALNYLLSEMTSKWVGEGVVIDDEEARVRSAMTGFWDAEESCRAANQRLRFWNSRTNVSQETRDVLARARKHIARILQEFPWEEFPRACNFGPGASTFLKRKHSSKQNKWQASRHITTRCFPYLRAFKRWAGLPDLDAVKVKRVWGNNVTTVPKTWKTERVIAIEPCWNSFFQKGVGKLIRRRLRKVGILLRDSQERHGYLARMGSVHKVFATLDLKSASDTICIGLVEALLPEDWLRVLTDLRSPYMGEGEARYRYQKWSSMGNGYTFELETLIFYALTVAIVGAENGRGVSVYGDDIIAPIDDPTQLKNIFAELGLTLNERKSFWGSHPFRESCGRHYYNGLDVTPFYLRRPIKRMGDFIVLANHAKRWGAKHCVPEVERLWEFAYRQLPVELRGPPGLEGNLDCEWDKATPIYDSNTQSFKVAVITIKHRWTDAWTWSGSYLFKLWEGGGSDEYDALEASLIPYPTRVETVGWVYIDKQSWH